MKLTTVLFETSTVPWRTTVAAPFGPVIVHATEASDEPPGSISFAETEPVCSLVAFEGWPSPLACGLDEHPT
jgi:hypothetical protein